MKIIMVIAALCATALSLFALTGCAAQTPVENAETETGKDYTGVFVDDLPLDEQLFITRCVELSSIAYWGEGGSIYSKEVAEAFLLGYPFLDYIKEKYGEIEPYYSLDQIAFLYSCKLSEHEKQRYALWLSSSVSHSRGVWFYLKSGTYQVNIWTDEAGTILGSSVSYCNGYQGFKQYTYQRTN